MVWNLDAHCPKDYFPSHNTFLKMQTQGSSHKNLPHSEKAKHKDQKSAPPCENMVELAKKEGKKKKKF